MANKNVFESYRGNLLQSTNTINEAGGSAYRFSDKHALAQYATTGCLNGTFYASANNQLNEVLALCERVEPEFIARTALYARQKGFMKDLPALLCAVLSVRSPGLMAEIFDRVIDTPKMLRNFVQIMRSGAVGRKSLGTLPKRLVLQWIENRSGEKLFIGSMGKNPSLADIIKMVHPKPDSPERNAVYAYLIGRDCDFDLLPKVIRNFEEYKKADDRLDYETPDVPFQMLSSLDLADWEWKAIARRAPWQTTRMNLNTFARHGVFDDSRLTWLIAERLRDETLISKAKVFPYQLMVAHAHAAAEVPSAIREALQDAMEIAVSNIPRINGKVYVFPDISGSMHSPLTGYRKGSSSSVRCLDVAALVSAAILRINREAEVIPFESKAIPPELVGLNPRDSIMTNAWKLSKLPCGGTNCSAPLKYLNDRNAAGDMVVYVSDNESWIDSMYYGHFGGSASQTMKEWSQFKARNPQARMVCIDMQPYGTTQAKEREDIVNVGGFSDQVFNLIAAVAQGDGAENYWISQIERIRL